MGLIIAGAFKATSKAADGLGSEHTQAVNRGGPTGGSLMAAAVLFSPCMRALGSISMLSCQDRITGGSDPSDRT